MELTERLDYNWSIKDLQTINKLITEYISDRENLYNELFNSSEDFDNDDVKEYIKYFMGEPSDDPTQNEGFHPNLYRLKHFLTRNYEMFLITDIKNCVDNIYCCLTSDLTYYETDELESYLCENDYAEIENESLKALKENWSDLKEKLSDYPLLNLDDLKHTKLKGVNVYYGDDTQDWVLNAFLKFIDNISADFPCTLARMDNFVLVPTDYIEFVGGEGTQAYYTDEAIFFADSCEKDDHLFYETCLYHEFAHFLFAMLSETYQQYWCDNYVEWRENGVKMTRDDDKNSQLDVFCEELWSDSFAMRYVPVTDEDEYIHLPSKMIMDTLDFVLRNEFVAE